MSSVVGDRIATIARITEVGTEEIDADGQVVTPGFIYGRTHMDAHGPMSDLPAGTTRLTQHSVGTKATVVIGSILTVDQEHTGNLPG